MIVAAGMLLSTQAAPALVPTPDCGGNGGGGTGVNAGCGGGAGSEPSVNGSNFGVAPPSDDPCQALINNCTAEQNPSEPGTITIGN